MLWEGAGPQQCADESAGGVMSELRLDTAGEFDYAASTRALAESDPVIARKEAQRAAAATTMPSQPRQRPVRQLVLL